MTIGVDAAEATSGAEDDIDDEGGANAAMMKKEMKEQRRMKSKCRAAGSKDARGDGVSSAGACSQRMTSREDGGQLRIGQHNETKASAAI